MKAIALTLIYLAGASLAFAQIQHNQSDLEFLRNRAVSGDFDHDGIADMLVADLVAGSFIVGFGDVGGGDEEEE